MKVNNYFCVNQIHYKMTTLFFTRIHLFMVLGLLLVQAMVIAQFSTPVPLSEKYPYDIGIETDPDVLFVEKFTGELDEIFDRYNEVLHPAMFSLDTDVPAASKEAHSLRIKSVYNLVRGGHLYKSFGEGYDSMIFLRYYVRYPSISQGTEGHQGVWFGGYNPPINWPFPQAGTCGLGHSRLSIAFENVWQETSPPGMDTYIYWGGMRSYDEGYTCFGNTLITQGKPSYGQPASPDAPVCQLDEWMCIEMMIRLNNPITAYNGELRVWIDGVEVGYWGEGFPTGHWFKDKWYNNPFDPPFEGFKWRTNGDLKINWIWIEYWHNSTGPSSYINFAHLVMAKKYIGPLYDPLTSIQQIGSEPITPIVGPNPVSDKIRFTDLNNFQKAELFDMSGRKVMEFESNMEPDISRLNTGIYILKIEASPTRHHIKILKQ